MAGFGNARNATSAYGGIRPRQFFCEVELATVGIANIESQKLVINNYPNPATVSTKIQYSVVENGQRLMPDISFGIVGQMDDTYFGIAFHHLTQPDQSVITGDQLGRLPVKITLHAGAKGHDFHHGRISREFTLSPNLVYQQQGSFKQINAGLYMKEDWLTFGLWYRNNLSIRPNSFVAMAGYQTEKFQFGYSFDYCLSNVSVYSYGSHEISMIFYFGEAHRSRFNRTMEIPQM